MHPCQLGHFVAEDDVHVNLAPFQHHVVEDELSDRLVLLVQQRSAIEHVGVLLKDVGEDGLDAKELFDLVESTLLNKPSS